MSRPLDSLQVEVSIGAGEFLNEHHGYIWGVFGGSTGF